MKSSDIQAIHQAGLISEEQRQAIITHFKLDRESNKLLVILSILGAILVTAGIILLIASNWENISRFVKLAAGLALLFGAHIVGWLLGREGKHPIIAEALHLIGAGMFLANIALVGQVYNLVSRPPNAILLWLLGIAPFAWILRSKAQHILTLCVFGFWLGLELNQKDSLLFFDGETRQFILYAIIGVIFSGFGILLNRTRFPEFGPATEKFGLLVLHIAAYPLTIGGFYRSDAVSPHAWIICGVATVLAVAFLFIGMRDTRLIPDRQWRWTWAFVQIGVIVLAWVALTTQQATYRLPGLHWIAMPLLFFFCLLQAQVGLIRRSPWLVNLAMIFIGLHTITAYFQLFGTMQTTGMMFLVTGVFLIVLAVYLERKRRSLLKRMNATPMNSAI